MRLLDAECIAHPIEVRLDVASALDQHADPRLERGTLTRKEAAMGSAGRARSRRRGARGREGRSSSGGPAAAAVLDRQRLEALWFLRALFGHTCASGEVLVWEKKRRRSAWFRADEGGLTRTATLLSGSSLDMYIGVGLRRKRLGRSRRGKARDICVLPGFWLDIDVLDARAHRKTRLPQTREAALALLSDFELTPSLVVDSGYGLHAWWLFDEPWVLDSTEVWEHAVGLSVAFQSMWKVLAKRQGYDLDQLPQLDAVMRCPGSCNWKDPRNPRPVELLHPQQGKPRTTEVAVNDLTSTDADRFANNAPELGEPQLGEHQLGEPQLDDLHGSDTGIERVGADIRWKTEPGTGGDGVGDADIDAAQALATALRANSPLRGTDDHHNCDHNLLGTDADGEHGINRSNGGPEFDDMTKIGGSNNAANGLQAGIRPLDVPPSVKQALVALEKERQAPEDRDEEVHIARYTVHRLNEAVQRGRSRSNRSQPTRRRSHKSRPARGMSFFGMKDGVADDHKRHQHAANQNAEPIDKPNGRSPAAVDVNCVPPEARSGGARLTTRGHHRRPWSRWWPTSNSRTYPSRSEAVFAYITARIRAGDGAGEIAQALLDRSDVLSERFYERTDPERFAREEIARGQSCVWRSRTEYVARQLGSGTTYTTRGGSRRGVHRSNSTKARACIGDGVNIRRLARGDRRALQAFEAFMRRDVPIEVTVEEAEHLLREHVRRAVEDPAQLVVLGGPCGIGKSEIAVRATAQRRRSGYRTGVLTPTNRLAQELVARISVAEGQRAAPPNAKRRSLSPGGRATALTQKSAAAPSARRREEALTHGPKSPLGALEFLDRDHEGLVTTGSWRVTSSITPTTRHDQHRTNGDVLLEHLHGGDTVPAGRSTSAGRSDGGGSHDLLDETVEHKRISNGAAPPQGSDSIQGLGGVVRWYGPGSLVDESGERVCRYPESAKEVAQAGLSMKATMCRRCAWRPTCLAAQGEIWVEPQVAGRASGESPSRRPTRAQRSSQDTDSPAVVVTNQKLAGKLLDELGDEDLFVIDEMPPLFEHEELARRDIRAVVESIESGDFRVEFSTLVLPMVQLWGRVCRLIDDRWRRGADVEGQDIEDVVREAAAQLDRDLLYRADVREGAQMVLEIAGIDLSRDIGPGGKDDVDPQACSNGDGEMFAEPNEDSNGVFDEIRRNVRAETDSKDVSTPRRDEKQAHMSGENLWCIATARWPRLEDALDPRRMTHLRHEAPGVNVMARRIRLATRALRVLRTAVGANDATQTCVRIADQHRRAGRRHKPALVITEQRADIVHALSREGPTVVMDAFARVYAPLLQRVTGRAVEIQQVNVPDGAPVERVFTYAAHASKRALTVRGRTTAWRTFAPKLMHAIERAMRAGARAMLVVTHKIIADELRRYLLTQHLVPHNGLDFMIKQWISAERTLDIGHFGAMRGLDRWRYTDSIITIGDPWPNLADVGTEMRFVEVLEGDQKQHIEDLVAVELGHAHGRGRAPRRARPLLALHYGQVAPAGWHSGNCSLSRLPRGRSVVRGMGQEEFEAALSSFDRTYDLADAIGRSPRQVRNYRSGHSAISPTIAERIRLAVATRIASTAGGDLLSDSASRSPGRGRGSCLNHRPPRRTTSSPSFSMTSGPELGAETITPLPRGEEGAFPPSAVPPPFEQLARGCESRGEEDGGGPPRNGGGEKALSAERSRHCKIKPLWPP